VTNVSRCHLFVLQFTAVWIATSAANGVFGQETFQPPASYVDASPQDQPASELDLDSIMGISQMEFQEVPLYPASFPTSTIFEYSDAPSKDSGDAKGKKTLEERLADLEKSFKKEKEAAEKKKDDEAKKKAADAKKEKKWYEKYTIRGYAQVRYNEILTREDGSAPPQYVGDRSVSEDQTFLLRRARLIISGDVSEHMAIYFQPDFASTPDGSTGGIHFAQLRDWYADCFIDKTKVHRVRVGQSKIPYGWENMQSSSNRLVLDRNDALNSAVRNERDFGAIYYWTPEPAQEFFTEVMDKGLKGSGNYGVFALGTYAGQGGSLAEQNDNLHVVSRFTLPFEVYSGQFAEVAMQGYTGRYSIPGSNIRALGVGPSLIPQGTIEQGNRRGILDERLAWTGVWYPQPLGFQTEWTIGRGPALNATQTAVEERALYGGYAMTMYQYKTEHRGILIPFLRWNYFKGGYKSERNSPFSMIDEWESGVEWQLNKQMELVVQYTLTDRTNTTAINQPGVTSYQQFVGDMLRVQFQFNY
jgi:hypothetical protein